MHDTLLGLGGLIFGLLIGFYIGIRCSLYPRSMDQMRYDALEDPL